MVGRTSNSLSYIRRQAKLSDDKGLDAVVIHADSKSKYRVSGDHLLPFVTAVDEEIARMEALKQTNDELIELYRIRYECVVRLKNIILEDPGIADNQYGKAIRAYLYLHASAADIVELQANKIMPISISEEVKQQLVNFGSSIYSVPLYYLLSLLTKNEAPIKEYNASFSQQYAQKCEQIRERWQRDDSMLLPGMDCSFIDGEPHLNDELKESLPQSESIHGATEFPLIADGKQSPERTEVLGEDNLKLLADIESYFQSVEKFLPKEQLRQYQEVETLLKQSKNNKDFFVQLKEKMPFIKYCHNQTQKERFINAAYQRAEDTNAEWYQTWTRRKKYANTGAEYLPLLLNKLDDVDQYLNALIAVINESKDYPAAEKAQDFVNIRKTKAVIKKERELIHESMLARLEIIHTKSRDYSLLFARLREINPITSPAEASIIDHTFYLLPEAIRNNVNIQNAVPEAYFSVDMIKCFVATIKQAGNDEHKARLQNINQDFIVKQLDNNVENIEDYEQPEFCIHLADDEKLNLHYLVTDNHISPKAFQADVEKMNELKNKIMLSDKDKPEQAAIEELESGEMDNKIFIYNLFEFKSAYEVVMTDEILAMPQPDRQFFATLFNEKSGLPEAMKKFFMLAFADANPVIKNCHHYNEVCNILYDDKVPSACFEKFLQLIESEGHNDDRCVAFLTLIQSIREIKQIDQANKFYNYVANMQSFDVLKEIDARVEAFKATSSSAQEIQARSESGQPFYLSEPEDDFVLSENLRKHIDDPSPRQAQPTPPKRNTWLPWILVGMAIGFVVAAAVVASIASFGIVPAGITLGVGIGAAVCLTTASTITGGFIGAFIKQCKDFFSPLNMTFATRTPKPHVPYSMSYKRLLPIMSPATSDNEATVEDRPPLTDTPTNESDISAKSEVGKGKDEEDDLTIDKTFDHSPKFGK